MQRCQYVCGQGRELSRDLPVLEGGSSPPPLIPFTHKQPKSAAFNREMLKIVDGCCVQSCRRP